MASIGSRRDNEVPEKRVSATSTELAEMALPAQPPLWGTTDYFGL
jgi:hypothetical protein